LSIIQQLLIIIAHSLVGLAFFPVAKNAFILNLLGQIELSKGSLVKKKSIQNSVEQLVGLSKWQEKKLVSIKDQQDSHD